MAAPAPAPEAGAAPPGFELIDELIYSVAPPKLVHPRTSRYDCGCRRKYRDGPICDGPECPNFATYVECIVGSCSKDRCCNKRFQRKQYADVAVFEVRCAWGASGVSGGGAPAGRRARGAG